MGASNDGPVELTAIFMVFVPPAPSGVRAIVTDGLDRALLESCLTLRLFFIVLRLLTDEGKTIVLVGREVVGRGLAAYIAVDAVRVDVVSSRAPVLQPCLLDLPFFVSISS